MYSFSCLNCFKLFQSRTNVRKFCSKSCSASYNNTGRVVSEIQKLKTSITIRRTVSAKSNYVVKFTTIHINRCSICYKLFLRTRKNKSNHISCSKKCQNILVSRIKTGVPNPKSKYAEKPIFRDSYRYYRSLCEFNIKSSEINKIRNFNLLKNFGIWSVENKNGVVRDHILSVRDGFLNNVPPNLIKHPANCQFLSQKDNSSKGCKSSITLEELKYRIDKW